MLPTETATAYRPILVSIAYRMTGEVMVSEDIVHDVLLNYLSRPIPSLLDSQAYLAKCVINACLNYLAQIKRQRQAYKGLWLPEPVLTPQHALDARLDISYGLMRVLEKLSPLERAVFVLKESFELAYADLAPLFGVSQANARQLYHRARQKITATARPFPIDPERQQALLQRFTQASRSGDIDGLIGWLKAEVILYSDGGGKVPAAIRPLVGAATVATFLRALHKKYRSRLSVRTALINGEPALLLTQTDTQRLTMVLVMETDLTGITSLYSIRNPDKLAHLN